MFSASPGKQIAVSSSLQPAAGINNANNGCSSVTIPAPSSSVGDMNRSPNNTLRVAGGIVSSNVTATASRTTEKVSPYIISVYICTIPII